ncbi:MAG: amidohydrolase family protein [Bryobacteraceae bacterium]
MKLLAATILLLSIASPASPAGVKAFTGATVMDGTGKPAIANATILVRDGKVEAVGPSSKLKVPAGAEIVDVSGKYVIPGMISTHVHISDVNGLKPAAYTEENTLRQLGVFARYGITTVWSLGGEKEPAYKAREMQNSPSLDRARIYLAGEVIVGKTPEEARQMVAKIAATKPDVIKIRVDDMLGTAEKMKPEVYKAVIEEAHRRGLRVAAHIFYLDDAKQLLRDGADVIAHSVRDKEIDAEFISLMKKRNIPYCPTLTREISTFAYESKPAFFSDPFFLREADRAVVAQLQEPKRQQAMHNSKTAQGYKAALPTAEKNLKKAQDAGIPIILGTDAGPMVSRFEGYFEHLEMQMMAESGLTPAQILRSATVNAASAMKVAGIGTLAKGNWADLVVLDKDPLADIRNTETISAVYTAGNPVRH